MYLFIFFPLLTGFPAPSEPEGGVWGNWYTESSAKAKPAASGVGEADSCYRPTITHQVTSVTSAGAWRGALNGFRQQKGLCALGARDLREDLAQR